MPEAAGFKFHSMRCLSPEPSDIAAATAVAAEPAAVAEGGRASGGGSVRMPSSTSVKLLIITRPSTLHGDKFWAVR